MLNHPMRRLRRGLLLGLALAGGVTACEDPFEITANYPNIDQNLEVWAITGSPPSYPSGILMVAPGLPQASAARLDASGSLFDIAFDIDTLGRLRVLPVGSVVSPVTGTRVIQFQRPTQTYTAIAEAPRTGWTADSVLLVGQGQSFLVRVSTQYCQFDIRQDIYAKFFVDSIVPEDRRIKLRGRINPNCGFRSFLDGFPEF